MLPGISTACLYPQHTEEALRTLLAYPIQAVEVFLNAAAELQPAFLRELRAIADAGGCRILSVHPYTSGIEPMYFFSSYDRRFAEGLDIYKRFFEAAGILGAELVVFHGAMRCRHLDPESYCQRYARLWEEAKRHGVELCHENVERCVSHHPAFFTAMRKALPQARFVLDTKQVFRAGEKLTDFLDAMGDAVAHLHISDHNPDNDCMVPGTGVLNIPDLLSRLGKTGYTGGVIVELYQDNYDGVVEIYQGYQHICTCLSTLRKSD